MARKPNPVLQKKWNEGYMQGKKDGIAQAVNFFAEKLEGLQDVPGIGEKTMRKIVDKLGHQYFSEDFYRKKGG